MLRDLLTVNELTNWNVKAPIEVKYRALKCHIDTVDRSSSEFNSVADFVHSSTDRYQQLYFNLTIMILVFADQR